MKKWVFLLIFATSAFCAQSLAKFEIEVIQIIEGTPEAISGDTLKFNDILIHLSGIDAPEISETCSISSDSWECGHSSKNLLASLIKDDKVFCEIDQKSLKDEDMHYAICSTEKVEDIGAHIVKNGLAFAFDVPPSPA